jgi:hypothetical protein
MQFASEWRKVCIRVVQVSERAVFKTFKKKVRERFILLLLALNTEVRAEAPEADEAVRVEKQTKSRL